MDSKMDIKASKCKIIAFGRNVNKTHVYNIVDNELVTSLEWVDIIKDLGILMDEKLSFKEHINNKMNKAYMMP